MFLALGFAAAGTPASPQAPNAEAPPALSVEQVRGLLEPEDRDLDLVPIWAKLGIHPDKPYLFDYEPGKPCVLPKGGWRLKAFCPETQNEVSEFGLPRDDARKRSRFELLLITAGLHWERQFLVFERTGAEDLPTVYRGNIDLWSQRYDYDPVPEVDKLGSGSDVFSLVTMAVSGTGILAFQREFYRIVDGRVKRVLSFVESGHMTGWGTPVFKEYECVLWPRRFSGPEDGIGMSYFLRYSSDGLTGFLGEGAEEVEDTYLFSAKGDAYFVWDPERKEYRLDPDRSDEPHALFEHIEHLDPAELLRVHRRQIEKLAATGSRAQKLWVKVYSDLARRAAEPEGGAKEREPTR